MTWLRRHGLFLVVLVLGGALRFAGVEYGLPLHELGQDEVVTLGRVREGVMKEGPATPAYNWPSLQVYASKATIPAVRGLQRKLGMRPSEAMVIGRGLTVALSTLTLVWVYLAAGRLFDRRIAVMSAAFLALVPIHVYRSRMWVPDAPMTMFYALALLVAVLILEKPRWRRFALAGVAIGLATATKYNGVGSALPVMVAAALAVPKAGGRSVWRRYASVTAGLGLAGAIAVATFFLVDPPALGRLPKLFRGALWVGELYRNEPPTGPFGWHIMRFVGSAYYEGGLEGVGPFITILAVVGALFLVACRSRQGVLVWLPPVLYLLLWSSTLRTAYERAFLPLVPHLAIAAGVAAVTLAESVESLLRRFRPKLRLVTGLLVIAALVPAPAVVTGVRASRHGDTRVKARAWLADNLPRGATIYYEWDMLKPTPGLFDSNDEVMLLGTSGLTPKQLARRCDYVVASSTTWTWIYRQRSRPGFAERAAVYDEIFDSRRFELVKVVEPGPELFGPEIRIYRARPPRGPRLRGSTVMLKNGGWGNSQRLRKGLGAGRFELWKTWDLAAGKAVLREPGRWSLTADVESRRPGRLSLSLGGVVREFEVGEAATIRHTVDLPAGQVWWMVKWGEGHRRGDRATVSDLRLEPAASESP